MLNFEKGILISTDGGYYDTNIDCRIVAAGSETYTYTVTGTSNLISKDENRVACSAGIYLVCVDGKAPKVIVK